MDYQEHFNSFLQRNDLKNKTKALEKIQYLLNTLPKYTRLENQILHDLLTLHYFFYNYTASFSLLNIHLIQHVIDQIIVFIFILKADLNQILVI